MDATYRNELREMNEAHYSRFEAKLEQRIAELRAELLASHAELKTCIAELRGEVHASLERGLRMQTAWFFVAWATMFATLVTLELRH